MKELERERTQFKGKWISVFRFIFFPVVDIFAFFLSFFAMYYSIPHWEGTKQTDACRLKWHIKKSQDFTF